MGNGHFIDSSDLHNHITGAPKVDVTTCGVRMRIYKSKWDYADADVAVFDSNSKAVSQAMWSLNDWLFKHNCRSACYCHTDG